MGTRSLTHFKHEDEILCTIYRQMDGYPEGHGKDLAEFLTGYKITNGINMDDEDHVPKLANGMGCLAAQVIAHFKTDIAHYQQMRGFRQEMANVYWPGGRIQDDRPLVDRKFRVGSIYMTTPGASGMWENFTYTVQTDAERRLTLKIETNLGNKNTIIFNDVPEKFCLETINKQLNDEDETNV